MGQQQLLVLVLAALIVSLIIASGIMAFHNQAIKANEDAVVHDLMAMTAKIEDCFRKPTLLGGVSRTTTMAKISSFHQLGFYEHDINGNTIIPDQTFHNENASYRLIPGDTLVIEAEPAEKPERRIRCRCSFSHQSNKLEYSFETVAAVD
ncbi:hypothetical protein JW992_01450 [candidate division KSB1 bacterium]|nr:hypothetical protein [candidate division KSB1 bacterium]